MQKVSALIVAMGILGNMTSPLMASVPAKPDGKALFDKNCSVCHSVMPPPKLAPPIVPIASRYRQVSASKANGVARMVAFMKSPTQDKILVDPQAITRFGLMPAMQLSDVELNAVASWVWDQGRTGGWGPGAGRGMGQGGCVQSK
jgi:cytochrome c